MPQIYNTAKKKTKEKNITATSDANVGGLVSQMDGMPTDV